MRKHKLTKLLVLVLIISLMIPSPAFAKKKKTSETETEETELVPRILDTDEVSTDEIVLYSSACVVMDTETGQVLYYKNPNDKHYPASITKVLTGLLLIENANLKDKITFTDECWDGVDYWTDMHIGMLNGERLSVEASLHAILLSSANEVCNQAAIYVSGSVKEFCKLMNKRAKDLGCYNTHFTNPNGLQDEDHYTTAYDMALISQEAIKNDDFRRITGTTLYTVKKTNKRKEGFDLGHKHRMLMWTDYHYDACIGGKTGYTPDAGNTLVTFAEKDGHTLVCITLENRDGHLYPDTIMALDYVFDNYDRLAESMTTSIAPQPPETEVETEAPVILSHEGEAPETIMIQTELETEAAEPAPQITGFKASLSRMITNREDPRAIAKFVGQSLVVKAGDLIKAYMPYSIPALALGFIILTLLLFWFLRVARRRRHLRKYRKIRKERLEHESFRKEMEEKVSADLAAKEEDQPTDHIIREDLRKHLDDDHPDFY